VYLHLIKHSRFSSPAQSTIFAGSIYLLAAFFFHYIFIVRDRDQKIFGRYEQVFEQNPKRKQHFLVSIGVLLLPYALLVATAICFPRH
jgi:hypothetical protein